ncbi:MAG: YitT family protein [Desulfotomaculaceae bacterium]
MSTGYFVQSIKNHFPSAGALKSIIINLLLILAGTLLVALSLNTIYIPHGLLAGGITGLALVLFYLFKIPIFLSIILLNIPVFWWGAREINRSFLFYSLAGTIALSAQLPATQGYLPIPQIDLILAAIYGGAISGAGFGLVFRGQGSTGGTDIVAVILRKKKSLGIGEVAFYSNLLVITISLLFFPLNTGLYTIISMFVTGKIIDVVITGLNTSKSVIIVSNQSSQIGGRIINELHRGVTYFAGAGGFTQKEKTVVNCVVHRFELARLKSIVTEVDPDAFMYISDASEVLGKGFSRGK